MQRKKNILIVDDEAPIRFAACMILERKGYNVSEASGGQQAKLMVISAHENNAPFDLLLLDVNMPDISGNSLFAELVCLGMCPPTIFVSGNTDNVAGFLLGDGHCMGVIGKPLNDDDLLKKVESAFSVETQKTRGGGEI